MSSRRWSRYGLIALCAALLGLDLVALLPLETWPFVDLPNHLAEATIFKHRHASSLPLSPYYASVVSAEKPSIAHIVLCSLGGSVETGNRVLYGVYILALPLLTLLIVRRMKGDVWVALLSHLALWNYSATWGFSGFTLAIPLVLLSHFVHLGAIAAAKPARHLAALAVIFPIIYWFHVLPLCFALLAYGLVELVGFARRRRIGRFLLRLTPVLPVLLLISVWIATGDEFRSGADGSFYADYYLHRYLSSLPDRLGGLFAFDNEALAAGRAGRLIATVLSAPIWAPAMLLLIRAARRRAPSDPVRTATQLFTLAALLAYLFLPDAIPDQNFLYQRYAVFVLLGLVMCVGAASGAQRLHYGRGFIVAAVTVHAAVWSHFFAGYRAVSRDFVDCFPRHPDSARTVLATIPSDVAYRGRPSLDHYTNYQIIWNLGAAPTKAIEYRFGVIRPGTTPLPTYVDFVAESELHTLRMDTIIAHYASCDGLLVHGDAPRALLDQDDSWERVRASSRWTYFRRRGVAPK